MLGARNSYQVPGTWYLVTRVSTRVKLGVYQLHKAISGVLEFSGPTQAAVVAEPWYTSAQQVFWLYDTSQLSYSI